MIEPALLVLYDDQGSLTSSRAHGLAVWAGVLGQLRKRGGCGRGSHCPHWLRMAARSRSCVLPRR